MTSVLLLNMPWVSVARPAIGVSLLKARLRDEGIPCDVRYPNLLFADRIGMEAYELVNEQISPAFFTGDWLFAQFLFGSQIDLDGYVATLRHYLGADDRYETILSLRSQVPAFLEDCIDRFKVARYEIVGFTTTFEQNLASLALARLIKSRFPEKTIVFGGGNCEGIMGLELHRSFPWIDLVCSGESDYSFPQLVKRLADRQTPEGLPGVVHRNGDGSKLSAAPDRVHDMDRLPDPDYDDYFQAVGETSFGARLRPALLIESARGCWWGAKSHCTFCGLNGSTMAFRAKSPGRVFDELVRQKQRYQIGRFLAVDNIMSYEYFRSLLPMLKERNPGVSLFYEIKSNLKREQVEMLRDAGVLAIQPGIESLNSHVLKLMRKGVSAIQNVQLLKWCREYGIEIAWNLLYGFPGETPEDYSQTSKTIEFIYHLKPPGAVSAIRLDRFSPNFDDAELFGLVKVRPFSLYRHLYPLPSDRVANLAYFFEYEYRDGRNPEAYLKETHEKIGVWKANGGGDLVMERSVDPELLITDTRPGRDAMRFPLNGLQRQLYEYCEEIRSRASIQGFAESLAGPSEALAASLDRFLDDMVDWQLMLRENNQYVSLAVLKGGRRSRGEDIAVF